jgi:hypothetical protein
MKSIPEPEMEHPLNLILSLAMASVLGNTAREVKIEAKVDIKIVESGVEEKIRVSMVRGYEWT